ncbi:MAG: HAMP domain-containing histidine kinase [Bacteroidales bacterium]|nr:HAMP domain-containing histidine kinase [Bacteroidales bacterium]
MELKELNATKDKFFSIIAHDLKNPFTNLIGSSELLLSRSHLDQENIQKLHRIIHDTSKRGYTLLSNLLEWARSQTGTISFDPTPIFLAEEVKYCLGELKSALENKNQVLTLDIPEKIFIMADKNMIQTVLRNLIHNAVKFTRKDGHIHIKATENKDGITFSIEDDGIGICRKFKQIIPYRYQVFHNGHIPRNRNGTWFNSLQEFIERHGGCIWAQSQPDNGSRFSFFIPNKQNP